MPDVRIAVVGAGYWGRNLVRNFDALGVLAAVCDSQAETLGAIKAQYPKVDATDSFRSVLANPAVSAIAIASPAETHYSMVKEVLLAEKHVFVEKPLALNEAEGRELHELASTKQCGPMIATNPVRMLLRSTFSGLIANRPWVLNSGPHGLFEIIKETLENGEDILHGPDLGDQPPRLFCCQNKGQGR